MKKLLAIVLAALMIAACSVTAFAADTTTVTYEVQPTYTVAIPAAVTLSDADITADVTASDVILESGKKIKVELTSASNTASGSTFNAKNGDSTVTYTITGDKAIAVGDTVATFTADGSKTLTFSAADKSAATAAGAHTETLTFDISVENAVTITYKKIGTAINPPQPLPANFTEVTEEEAWAYGHSFTDTVCWLVIYAKDGNNYKFVRKAEWGEDKGTNTWENIIYGESGCYPDPNQVSIIAPVTE